MRKALPTTLPNQLFYQTIYGEVIFYHAFVLSLEINNNLYYNGRAFLWGLFMCTSGSKMRRL